jgi:hypothetical protein
MIEAAGLIQEPRREPLPRHQRLQLFQQRRQVVAEGLPDATPIHAIVSMHEPMAHADDACPRNVGVSVLKQAVHATRSLAQNDYLAEDRPPDSLITNEFRLAQSGGYSLSPVDGLNHVEDGSMRITRHRRPLSNSGWRPGV